MAKVGTTTEAVKEELARAAVGKACCCRAEVATMLRFAGTVSGDRGRVVVAAELDTAAAAQRLRTLIGQAFDVRAQLAVLPPTPRPRQPRRWAVQVTVGGDSLARRCGLLDEHDQAVRGLPPQVVAGARCAAEAIWRAAILAGGAVPESGKGTTLTVTCPGAHAALLSLALTGAARRLHAPARAREVRGLEQVSITDPEAVAALLARLGAPEAARTCQRARATVTAGKTANTRRPPAFDDANTARSAVAARVAAGQLARALEILDPHVPAHLAAAARLRIAHPEITLEQLGALCDPPLSKDTVAGRLRRLRLMADARAAELGIPTASSCRG